MQVRGRMQGIEEGRLLQVRVGKIGHECRTVPQRPRHVEVQESESTGIGADLVGHPGNIDDPNVKALLLKRERILLESQIDGIDRGIANRLDFSRKRISSREEADRWECLVDDGADPKAEGGGGDKYDWRQRCQWPWPTHGRSEFGSLGSRLCKSLRPIRLTSAESVDGGGIER